MRYINPRLTLTSTSTSGRQRRRRSGGCDTWPLKALMLTTELRADALREVARLAALTESRLELDVDTCRSLPTLRLSSMPRGRDWARRRSSSIASVSVLRRYTRTSSAGWTSAQLNKRVDSARASRLDLRSLQHASASCVLYTPERTKLYAWTAVSAGYSVVILKLLSE